jgi:hypothetical protein
LESVIPAATPAVFSIEVSSTPLPRSLETRRVETKGLNRLRFRCDGIEILGSNLIIVADMMSPMLKRKLIRGDSVFSIN